MSAFKRIVGHKKNILVLERILKSDKVPHAFLFFGPSGVGKKQVALSFAQSILEPTTSNEKSRVLSSQHPDLLMVTPDGASIKIEQVREILRFAQMKPFEGKAKVVIIDDAHLMNPTAANSLLKTLEEPTSQTYFILLTIQRSSVISTIQSRCQKMGFGTLQPDEIKSLGQFPEWVLELAQGQVDLAKQLTDPKWSDVRNKALETLETVFDARTFEGFQAMAELHEERDSSLFSIRVWLNVFRQTLELKWRPPENHKIGHAIASDPKQNHLVATIARKVSAKVIQKWGESLVKLEQDILHNINRALAFEEFWLSLKESLKEKAA